MQELVDCASDTSPNSLADIMVWQKRIRGVLDEVVIEKLQPVFNHELNCRFGDSITEKREASSWANAVLHEAHLCVASSDGSACSFVAHQGRPSDRGRLALERHNNVEKPTRKIERIVPPFNVKLIPIPYCPHPFSRAN